MRNHPKALPYLFLTELWERFGFYVVQGMLVLFMTKAYGYTDDKSFIIQGLFTSLVYISPVVGGFLADRLLGFRMSIVWGGILLIIGYALLATPAANSFYLSLAIIVVGNGLFKPNISSLLGALYAPDDANRDTGFTIFYIGINLGVLIAGLLSGVIQSHFGWYAGFALASGGLIIGLITFAIGIKRTGMIYPFHPKLKMEKWLSKPLLCFYFIVAILIIDVLLQSSILGKWLLPLVGIGLLIFIFALAFKQTPQNRSQLLLLNILMLASIVFWTLFWQIFSSVTLYIDRTVDKELLGFAIPTQAFYTLECVFIILLGPIFAWIWQTLREKDCSPSPILKFVFSMIFTGLGFLALAVSTYFASTSHLISPLWVVLSYCFITIGELLLSPIGLSAVTMLSPTHLTGMMMGIWFSSLGFGGQFSGLLAKLSSVPANTNDLLTVLPIYRHAFLDYTAIAFVVAVILFIIYCCVKKTLVERPLA